jgi:hypothetical protein
MNIRSSVFNQLLLISTHFSKYTSKPRVITAINDSSCTGWFNDLPSSCKKSFANSSRVSFTVGRLSTSGFWYLYSFGIFNTYNLRSILLGSASNTTNELTFSCLICVLLLINSSLIPFGYSISHGKDEGEVVGARSSLDFEDFNADLREGTSCDFCFRCNVAFLFILWPCDGYLIWERCSRFLNTTGAGRHIIDTP